MAKSRSELPLRGAEIPRFTLNKLRNLRDSPRGKGQCLARAKKPYRISSPLKGGIKVRVKRAA